jgi:hypothetical protein
MAEGDLMLLVTGVRWDDEATQAWAEKFDGVLHPETNQDLGKILDKGWVSRETYLRKGETAADRPWAWPEESYARWSMAHFESSKHGPPEKGLALQALEWGAILFGPGLAASGIKNAPSWLLKITGAGSKAGLASNLATAYQLSRSALMKAGFSRATATQITRGAAGLGGTGLLASSIQAVLDPESTLQLGMPVEQFMAMLEWTEATPIPMAPMASSQPAFDPVGSVITNRPGSAAGAPGAGVSGGGVPGGSDVPGYTDLETELALAEQDPWIGYEDPFPYITQDPNDPGQGFIDWPYPMRAIDPTFMGDGPEAGDLQAVPFRYKTSDVKRVLGDMSPGAIIAFQAQAVNAGLIDGDFVIQNRRTMMEEEALAVLMHNANGNGTTWQSELNTMEQVFQAKPKPSETRGPFVAQSYLEPDYATLAQYAKSTIRNRLGREINDWELSMLADEMKMLNRMEFDAAEEQRLETWRAEGRAMDDELTISEPGRAMDDELTISEPEPVQAVDSTARFSEFFETKFGAEQLRREGLAETQSKTAGLMAGIQRMADMMGGG